MIGADSSSVCQQARLMLGLWSGFSLVLVLVLGAQWFDSGALAAPSVSSINAVPTVSRPLGQTAVFLGGGVALASDLSAVDHNPAGISVGKIFSVEAATAWRSESIQSSEVGVIDSMTSDVAAGLKFRQTSGAVGHMERRFSLALADRVGQTGALVGIAGDYKERPEVNSAGMVTGDGQYYDLRVGAVYNLNSALRLAVRTGGYFDKAVRREHALGVGGLVAGQLVLHGDLIFVEESPDKATVGVGLIIRKYFDIRASYGYLLEEQLHQAAGGFFLVSPKASLFYLTVAENLKNVQLEHQLGLRLALAF